MPLRSMHWSVIKSWLNFLKVSMMQFSVCRSVDSAELPDAGCSLIWIQSVWQSNQMQADWARAWAPWWRLRKTASLSWLMQSHATCDQSWRLNCLLCWSKIKTLDYNLDNWILFLYDCLSLEDSGLTCMYSLRYYTTEPCYRRVCMCVEPFL